MGKYIDPTFSMYFVLLCRNLCFIYQFQFSYEISKVCTASVGKLSLKLYCLLIAFCFLTQDAVGVSTTMYKSEYDFSIQSLAIEV